MHQHRFRLVVVSVCACIALYASRGANAQSPPNSSSPQMHKDAPFHTGGEYKSEVTAASKPQVTPVADHNAYPQVPLAKIEILPAAITISGSHYNQRLVVEGTYTDGHQEDLTAKATLGISNPKIARLVNDFAIAEGDGEGSITAALQGHRVSIPIDVKHFSVPAVWSFRNDVLPVMTKMGCNSGPCHGAAAGKNGFKLTLRGYDPDTDYLTLTHQALARRTERIEPAKSLILLKPTLTIPHGGGKRFAVDSPEYQVVSGWIAQGMPAPQDSDARVTTIEVSPPEASLRPGAEQQLIVTAVFSDGRKEDVTRWAKYDSGNEGVATVDNYGHVIMHSFGEAPVTVWYQSHVTFSRLRIPFPYHLDEVVFQKAPRHNYIDDDILHHLDVLHIPPSPPAGDSEFIRRAYLDAAGILPSPAEVEQFLKDPAPDKRDRLIDALMKRPEFVDYWAYKWSDLLLVSSNHLSNEEMWSYYDWIHDSVAANKAWDKFVYQIVTATGNTVRERGGQLLGGPSRSPGYDGKHGAGVPGDHHYLRALPQSSAGEVDAKRLLRHGQSLRTRAAEDLCLGEFAPGRGNDSQ